MKNAGKVLVIAGAALLLAGCASKEIRAQREAAKAAKAAAAAGKPVDTDVLLARYRRVKKGDEFLYCSKDDITGSRTQKVETCLTEAQLQAQRQDGQEVMRRIQQNPGSGPVTNPDGSVTQGAASFP